MRESALEGMRLHGNRKCRHEPRPIGELISQQPLHTFLISRISCRHVTGDMQRIKRFSRRISLAWNAGKLAPTPVAVLSGLESFHERLTLCRTDAGVGQSIKLHRS